MNAFDLAVILGALLAGVLGFRSGLIRSLATMFAYVAAVPLAVHATALVQPLVGADQNLAQSQNLLIFFGILLVIGFILGIIFRAVIDEMVGRNVWLIDRFAGAVLGIGRVVFLAMTVVLVFARVLPANLQPAYLTESRLKPGLLALGEESAAALPPEVEQYIDSLKRIYHLPPTPPAR